MAAGVVPLHVAGGRRAADDEIAVVAVRLDVAGEGVLAFEDDHVAAPTACQVFQRGEGVPAVAAQPVGDLHVGVGVAGEILAPTGGLVDAGRDHERIARQHERAREGVLPGQREVAARTQRHEQTGRSDVREAQSRADLRLQRGRHGERRGDRLGLRAFVDQRTVQLDARTRERVGARGGSEGDARVGRVGGRRERAAGGVVEEQRRRVGAGIRGARVVAGIFLRVIIAHQAILHVAFRGIDGGRRGRTPQKRPTQRRSTLEFSHDFRLHKFGCGHYSTPTPPPASITPRFVGRARRRSPPSSRPARRRCS